MQIFIQKLAQFVNKTVSLHQIELDEEAPMQIFIQKLAQFVNKTVSLHQIELDEENIVKPPACECRRLRCFYSYTLLYI